MIEREGTHTCAFCGKTYDWFFQKFEKRGEISFKHAGKNTINISGFTTQNGRIRLSSKCPHCGKQQPTYLVDEEYTRTN